MKNRKEWSNLLLQLYHNDSKYTLTSGRYKLKRTCTEDSDECKNTVWYCSSIMMKTGRCKAEVGIENKMENKHVLEWKMDSFVCFKYYPSNHDDICVYVFIGVYYQLQVCRPDTFWKGSMQILITQARITIEGGGCEGNMINNARITKYARMMSVLKGWCSQCKQEQHKQCESYCWQYKRVT